MKTTYSKNEWRNARHQLLAIALSVLIPYILRLLLAEYDENLVPLHTTAVTSFIAAVCAVMAIRSFDRYPGIETVSGIFPTVSIVYSLVAIGLLILRLDYARAVMISNFLVLCGLLIVFQIFRSRSRKLRVAIIQGGAEKIEPINNVEWVVLEDPLAPLNDIDIVAANFRANLTDAWERRLADFALAGRAVYNLKHLKESLTGQLELEHISETSAGTLLPRAPYLFLKKTIDTTFALLLLVVLAPVMAIIGILIRIDTPGPAIFKQTRIGFQGKPFLVKKFRTMSIDASQSSGREAAMTKDNDPRITSVGRYLRLMRLDEIPQLVNVLRGEMSLIGPRPEAEVLSEWYEQEIPFYRYRHVVLPGVTGWAQINQGHVTTVNDVKEKLNYDFYYIKNLSPWLDALIAIRTAAVMLSRRGAR